MMPGLNTEEVCDGGAFLAHGRRISPVDGSEGLGVFFVGQELHAPVEDDLVAHFAHLGARPFGGGAFVFE